MASLLAKWRGNEVERSYSLEQYIQDTASFYFNGLAYNPVQQTYQKRETESIEANFTGLVSAGYKRNGIVFACQLVRLQVFSGIRLMFQQMRAGRPGDMFGGLPALDVLEKPWPNGSTGDLLAKMIQDVDLAGNSYIRRTRPTANELRLERLRPDWVTIVLGANSDLLTADVAGYLYQPGGPGSGKKEIPLSVEEVCHWAPISDPMATYRGMTWLTPIIREFATDSGFTDHKQAFLDHSSTPNMAIKFDPSIKPETVEKFKTAMEGEHRGVSNAYKTLYLGGGADVTVVGSSFKDMDFKAIQGATETRIAAAAGVHPAVVGLAEGLQGASLNAGNFAAARRLVADKTMHHLWRTCAASLETIIDVPSRARLWFDTSDVPFLREDQKDAAEIQATKAQTIATLVREGFTAKTVVAAVESEDFTLLEHSGALSVQLIKPGDDPTEDDDVPVVEEEPADAA